MTTPQDPPPAWTAPGGSGEPRPDEAPQSATPPGWGAPQQPPGWGPPAIPPPGGWGAPPVPPGQYPPVPGGLPGAPPPGWRPPALQPGIIPLRPLSLGEILDGGVRAIRHNPKVMFGLSAAVVTVAVLLSVLLGSYLAGLLAGTFSDTLGRLDPTLDPTVTGELDSTLGLAVGQVISAPVTAVATTILTGLLVVSVSRSVLGRSISVREVLRSRRVWWVLGFTALAMVAIVLAVTLLTVAVVLLARQDLGAGAATVGIIGGLGLAVVLVWFTVRTLLVTPALMLEGKGFWTSVARAWRLTRRSFWRLFGIYLLVAILMYFLGQVISAPFAVISMFIARGDVTSFAYLATLSVSQIISLTATTMYQSAVVALLYIDVRMRREGLDIELGRAATADATAAAR